MITTLTTQIPKGKMIQIMADTSVEESYQLAADEKAMVTIHISKVLDEGKKEGE